MNFIPGDRVHLAGVGTGIIREARGSGRFAIEIKGRIVIAAAADLAPAEPSTKRRKSARASSTVAFRATADKPRARQHSGAPDRPQSHLPAPGRTQSHLPAPGHGPALDLHGKTVADALAAVEAFINDMLLEGHGEVRVIHGRSGGRVKAAVHEYLRRLPVVASFGLEPHNAGITIVTFT